MAGFVERLFGKKGEPVEAPEMNPERLLAAVVEVQAALNEESRATTHTELSLRLASAPRAAIAFMSDLHMGGRGVDHEAIVKHAKLIARTPNMYVYLGGDPVENYVIDKLAHAGREAHLVPPSAQWRLFRYVVELLLESGSLIATGAGNHDLWTHRVAGVDGTLSALRDLPVIYTGEGGYLNLEFGHAEYTIFRKHRPGFSSRYNPGHSARQALRFATRLADIVVIEHQHEPNIEVGRMFGEERVFLRTGSYKVYDPHALEFGFNNSAIGVPTVVLNPFTRAMVPFSRVEDAAEYLDLFQGAKMALEP